MVDKNKTNISWFDLEPYVTLDLGPYVILQLVTSATTPTKGETNPISSLSVSSLKTLSPSQGKTGRPGRRTLVGTPGGSTGVLARGRDIGGVEGRRNRYFRVRTVGTGLYGDGPGFGFQSHQREERGWGGGWRLADA